MTPTVTLGLTLLSYGQPVMVLPNPPVATATDAAASSSSTTASSVTFDSTAANMGACALTVIDPTGVLVPTSQGGLLLPAGNEIAITYTGVPVGVFGITVNDVTDTVDTSGGSISGDIGPVMAITGADRSFLASAAVPTGTTQTRNGIPLGAATFQLIMAAIPWLDPQLIILNDNGAVLPSQIIEPGTNPWQLAQSWWNGLGGLLYWNGSGQLIGTFPPANGTPSYDWYRGGNDITGIEANFDATQAYNGVTVQAVNGFGIPVQATAWDTNPASPTYYLGSFGQRAAPPIQSDIPGTVADCQNAAIQLLPAYLGLANTTTVTLVPDPTIFPYAYAAITSKPDGVSGIWQVQSCVLTLDYTASESVVCVPGQQPPEWGQAGQAA